MYLYLIGLHTIVNIFVLDRLLVGLGLINRQFLVLWGILDWFSGVRLVGFVPDRLILGDIPIVILILGSMFLSIYRSSRGVVLVLVARGGSISY